MAERERRVRGEEAAAARGGDRVIPDQEGDTPPTDEEGRSPSEKRARGEGDEGGHVRRKRRRVEKQGAGGARGAPWPASPSPEPTLTDWGSALPLPRHCVRHPARREPETVKGWRAGEVAALVRYVKMAGRTRGGQERRGTLLFRDLVHRAGMAAGRSWRRTGGGGCWGTHSRGWMCGPRERRRKPRVQMPRELLQREGWY